MDFIQKDIQDYSARHTAAANDLLEKIDRETHVNVLRPRMLSGHVQGRILSMLSHMIRPHRILEIGTYTGYSALCMAEGLQGDGELITIDVNEELEPIVEGYFQVSPYADQLKYLIGNAMDLIPTIEKGFDLVFIDADKVNYLNYYELILPKMNAGGFIIADNILWSGKVTTTPKSNDKDTLALIEFNKKVHEDTRVENVLLAVRDGLMILRVL
ncbi:class I SAM-dependent methyltransferase [Reichenbachiella carrageenanivorans]|uniref:Class I SAM-dependent methyltransferase n=1 Tax=Reichenbachiella carrageenanivorans TaxID=2979869 RepID=A0ABY6CYB1_9BACT|nr:class I SAM-dependent methyltransferase [Reichenbachiella carrageenanivorans]UXX78902.1 class I SAM-dependent methyltransferase [Reichenbachiella carrageenanivorans]